MFAPSRIICSNFLNNLLKTTPETSPLRIYKLNGIHTSIHSSSSVSTQQTINIDPIKNNYVKYSLIDENREFQSLYPQLINDIVQTAHPDLRTHIDRMYEYNLKSTGNLWGLLVVKAYKMMEKPENLTEENIRLANIMGWLIKMSGEVVFMSDDVIDQSLTRRGKPCWYTKKEIGLGVINDYTLMENGTFYLLNKYFKHCPYYVPIMHLFQDANLKTFFGQMAETVAIQEGKNSLDNFTMDKFSTISRLKAGQTTYSSIAVAMYMANITDPLIHKKSEEIITDMAIYYQVYNDYWDCYGSFEDTGKSINEDIRCRRVTWFSLTALQLATPIQRKLFSDHYGKNSDESVAIIHNLYEELQLKKRMKQWQNDAIKRLRAEVAQLPPELTFHRFLVDHLDEVIHGAIAL